MPIPIREKNTAAANEKTSNDFMQQGKFIPTLIPFVEHGRYVPAEEQALTICLTAMRLLQDGAPGVAITYSANYGQTRDICNTYESGGWRSDISGANQAEVMMALEDLLATDFAQLRHKLHIAPITTLTYDDFGDKTHEAVVREDLARIEALLAAGWSVLGWMNQATAPRYAVGGGVVRLPEELDKMIQERLAEMAEMYA
jgi:hypothetical protein